MKMAGGGSRGVGFTALCTEPDTHQWLTMAVKPKMTSVLRSRELAVGLVLGGCLDHVSRSGSRALPLPLATETSHASRCGVLVNAHEPTDVTPTSANPGRKWSDGLFVAWKGEFARFAMLPLSRRGRRRHVHRVSVVAVKVFFRFYRNGETKHPISCVQGSSTVHRGLLLP